MRRAIIWILIFAISGSLLFVYIYYRNQQSNQPIAEIKKAREILTIAQKKGARKKNNSYYKKASVYYDSSMIAWKAENKKFLFSRDYSRAKKYAKKSHELAQKAIEFNKYNRQRSNDQLTTRINNLKKKLKNYNSLLGDIPLSTRQQSQLTKGEIVMKEGMNAFEKKDYENATDKLDKAEALINPVIAYAQNEFDDYFKNDALWQSWISTSISESRKNNTPLIIVDKYAHECNVYQGGQKKYTFKVELGRNWVGHKNYQGDYSTPEGFYKIIEKRSHPFTRYHKAMLINYPNEQDKERFYQNKRSGRISRNTSIGNNIEIHGDGGKGADWTKGCIALENSEIDHVYAMCGVGTMVTIVGSTKTKRELLNVE